jgi:tRNA threonylcarbamoyl adenosine modification protein YeaZ
MKILFLDTASKDNLLALCNEERTIVLTHLAQKGDSELMPVIEETLEKAKLTYEHLTQLACAVGPGGFTSLRVGVTAVNTLAYALDLPTAGIHLSEIWRARVELRRAQHDTGFLWLHSTRRTQLFAKGFRPDGTSTPTVLMDLEEAKSLWGLYAGELIEEHKQALTQCMPVPEEELLPLEETLPKLLAERHYTKKSLLPWYGREG